MKTTSRLRSFLAIASSSLLTVSYSHGQTILADDYLTSLNVTSDTTLFSSLNFPSILNGPLTGSSNLTHTGYFGSQLSLVNNTGNTFTGNIIVDSGTLRIAGNPFAASGGGFVAGSMTASDTITINRAGTLLIDDTVTGGYAADRFGSGAPSARPAFVMNGGAFTYTGANNAAVMTQTFGGLTLGAGLSTITVNRTTSGTPTLVFDSLTQASGSLVQFASNATLGSAAADVPKITFATGPATIGGGGAAGTSTISLVKGARTTIAAGASNFIVYGANGIRSLALGTETDDRGVNINGAGTTANVRLQDPTTATITALTGVTTVNSLIIGGGAGSGVAQTWAMGNKLILTSGMLLKNSNNNLLDFTSGTLTAGDGTNPVDLNIIVATKDLQFKDTGTAVIADNASSVVTLVASGSIYLYSGAANTYSGGTRVVEGTLRTGTTANRSYLGTGKAVVDNAALILGAIGATSNATGDDFTAKNGGTITLSSGNHGSVDTFNIDANSVIAGVSATNSGLASLTRGTNITLAAGAIIGHAIRGSALNLTNGTIQNLGTNADLYYGFYLNQNNAAGQITIGNGTAFRGISTDRSAKEWQLGTINIASGTTSVDFQGVADYGAAAALTLGNGATGGQPVITSAVTGTVDINARGLLTINDSTATFGNTASDQNIRFVSTAGSTLTVTAATGMGSGTGIASAIVNNGGSLAIGNTAALNGAVTVEAGGRFTANQTSLTGAGALTFNAGSIINITNATGFSGSQATAATVNAGTLVKLNVASFGTATTTLDSQLGSGTKSVSYIHSGNNAVNPTAANTALYTLNKNSGGFGGILTNDATARTVSNLGNGKITLGANGGVIAATTNFQFNIQENIDGAGSLTIGTTDIIDGAPKAGIVNMDITANGNTYTGGTIVNAGTARLANDNVLGAITNSLTVNMGGTVNMNAKNLTVGNLTGTGGVINIGGASTLTIGQGDNGGGNYQGSIQDATGKLTKTGTGTITLSGANTYTGATTVSAGKLSISSTGTINGTSSVAIGAGDFNYNNSTTALSKGITFSGTGGTLSGTGTITPAVVITSGNRQTAGSSVTSTNTTASVGKEIFSTSITYNQDSIFEWNLNADNGVGLGTRATDYDAVNTASLATTGTKAIFRVILNGTDNFDETFWDSDRTWSNIFTALDGSTAFNIENIFQSTVEYYNSAGLVANGNTTGRSFTISGTSLTWSAIPEPTSALAGLLLTAGLLRRRRK